MIDVAGREVEFEFNPKHTEHSNLMLFYHDVQPYTSSQFFKIEEVAFSLVKNKIQTV